MQIDLAPSHHFVVNAEGSTADGDAYTHATPHREPPWRRPLPQRLRIALNLGVVCCFLVAGLLIAWIRANGVAQQAQDQVRAEARALASGIAPALEQRDRVDLRGVLEGMVHRRDLAAVAVHDASGRRLAAYAKGREALGWLSADAAQESLEEAGVTNRFPAGMLLHQPVRDGTQLLGTLILYADLTPRWHALYAEMAWICAALLGSLLLCAALVNAMQQRLIEPVYRLERTCKVIVEDRDYTLRAWKASRDEVGTVVDCINHLLDELHRRGGALVEARAQIADALGKLGARPAQTPAAAPQAGWRTHFLANMCHEIRTPLNRAGALCRDLEATSLTPSQRELVTAVHATGDLVVALLDDLLDYTRMDSGRLELQVAEFDPREVIHTTLVMFSDRARSRHLDLVFRCDDAVPMRVRGDRTRLRQVIATLVGNALKYAQAGEIAIELHAQESDGGCALRIDVLDSGFGIAEEARLRVYEALTETLQRRAEPTGSAALGIVIANELIQRMGGTLTMLEAGRGHAGFSFMVRVEAIHDTATPAPTKPTPAPRAIRARRRGGARDAESVHGEVSEVSKAHDAVEFGDPIAEVYLDSAPELVETVRVALEQSDTDALLDAARTLGACSARVGANQVADLCRHIEQCVQQRNDARLQPLLGELAAAFERARASLRREGAARRESAARPPHSLSTTLQ